MKMETENAQKFHQAVSALCPRLRVLLLRLPEEIQAKVSEIRLHVGRPVCLWNGSSTWFLTDGGVTPLPQNGICATKTDLYESFRTLCSFSVYSYQEQIREGYVTLRGGHRAGLGGTAVFSGGRVSGMRDITSVNLRIARQIEGCAQPLLQRAGDLSGGLLLAGPPASGKTTLLRDIARQLSSGACGRIHKVTVVDERGELCGASCGEYGSDLGPCCDVLDGFPKAEGMLMALRTLSPEYLICDELGTRQETEALLQSVNAGASVVASIHAGSLEQLASRPQAYAMLQSGAFQHVALLAGGKPGRITKLVKAGDLLAQSGGGALPHLRGNSGGLPAIA
ncbi:MAG: stage III sporulation protein AA [Oscillospiraceae bacterium]|jgi:stage III sporulation protein AA|nr:stage III sporulation protein AA [Oscillospiraceae bacterium]MDD3262153.1 stage III sporulation protein AA [Oscillospiraceae bacterium]